MDFLTVNAHPPVADRQAEVERRYFIHKALLAR